MQVFPGQPPFDPSGIAPPRATGGSGPAPLQVPAGLMAAMYQAALLLSVTAFWMFTLLAGLRSGLGDGYEVLAGMLVFTLLPLWLPLWALASTRDPQAACLRSCAALAGALLAPVAGLVVGAGAALLAALVLVAAAVRLRGVLPGPGWRALLRLVGVGFILAAVLLTCSAAERFFVPEAITLGLASTDNYFHVAISQMVLHFGVPSTGGDGLVVQHYHFGFHVWAALLATAVGAPAALVHVYGVVVTLKLALVMALVACSLHVSPPAGAPHAGYARLAWVTLFVLAGAGFFESASFVLAMVFLVGVFPLAVGLATRQDLDSSGYRTALALVALATGVCAVSKVSAGFLLGLVLLWILWRGRRNRANLVAVLLALAVLAACTALFLVPRELGLGDISPHILRASYQQYLIPLTFASYLLPVGVVAAAWLGWRTTSGRLASGARMLEMRLSLDRFTPAGAHTPLLAAADLLALCTLACLLVLVTVPIGSNMAYFSGIVFFMSAALLPWSLLRHDRVRADGLVARFAVVLVSLLVVWWVSDYRETLGDAYARVLQASRPAVDEESADAPVDGTKRQLQQSLASHGNLFGRTQAFRQQTPWMQAIRGIEQQRSAGARPMVYVPPQALDFWTRLKGESPYWCLGAHLMIPAQSGIPMVLGITPQTPDLRCMPRGIEWYGFGVDQDKHRSVVMSDAQLCARVRPQGFDTVIVLNTIAGAATNRVVRCPKP